MKGDLSLAPPLVYDKKVCFGYEMSTTPKVRNGEHTSFASGRDAVDASLVVVGWGRNAIDIYQLRPLRNAVQLIHIMLRSLQDAMQLIHIMLRSLQDVMQLMYVML